MTTESLLIENRTALKHRLTAGEYKTLVDIFLEWFNRLIQKITRQTKPLPLWLMLVILSLVVNLIVFGTTYLIGGSIGLRNAAQSFGLGYGLGILSLISLLILDIITVIVMNESLDRIFVLWRDDILDATESATSLQAFEDWLGKVCNRRLYFLAVILLVLVGATSSGNLVKSSISNGFTIGIILIFMFGGAIFYQIAMVILLPMMLRRYDMKLFAADPATSELLSRLSGELGFFVYFIAFFSAISTLAFIALGGQEYGLVLILLFWIPIIAMFVLNQTALSSIVRRAKWKTLNEIQARVEKLQAAENLESKETMEAVKRLMDYHMQVKATRDSALDIRSYLSFINSLLLTLFAFLLSNLDKALNLFVRKP